MERPSLRIYWATVAAGAVVAVACLFASPAAAQLLRGPGQRAAERERRAEAGEAQAGVRRDGRNRAGRQQAGEKPTASPAAEPYRKAVEALDKGETDAAITLLDNAVALGPEVRPGLLRPRPGLDPQGRAGQGHRRPGSGDRAGPRRRPQLLPSRLRLFPEGPGRGQAGEQTGIPGKSGGRLFRGHSARPEIRRRLSRSRLRPRAWPATWSMASKTSIRPSGSIRRTRPPTSAAPRSGPRRKIGSGPSPTMARRSSWTPRTRRAGATGATPGS